MTAFWDDANSSMRVDLVRNENIFRARTLADSLRTRTMALMISGLVRKELKQKEFLAAEKEKLEIVMRPDWGAGAGRGGGGSRSERRESMEVELEEEELEAEGVEGGSSGAGAVGGGAGLRASRSMDASTIQFMVRL